MKHSPARVIVAASVAAAAAVLSPACARAPVTPYGPSTAQRPSQLDYVVFASLADSSSLIAVSAYRARPATRVVD